ncbi:MAG TPA: helix-hairpin-helix domain-containing protein [Methylomirabilota bacterium]|nr:helix-hairpin-helix domain-containing protein [Methylomirabilota bacterium]
MALYTGRQLLLLFVFLAAAGAGLAVRQWRAAHPVLAERLEQLDRRPAVQTAAAADHRPVDLNHATAAELARLPGVGPWLAARIVERRQVGGAFGSIEDLRAVRGIGAAKLERLRKFVTVGE